MPGTRSPSRAQESTDPPWPAGRVRRGIPDVPRCSLTFGTAHGFQAPAEYKGGCAGRQGGAEESREGVGPLRPIRPHQRETSFGNLGSHPISSTP